MTRTADQYPQPLNMSEELHLAAMEHDAHLCRFCELTLARKVIEAAEELLSWMGDDYEVRRAPVEQAIAAFRAEYPKEANSG